MPVSSSRKQSLSEQLGIKWNSRMHAFNVCEDEDGIPEMTLNPHEVIALGVELVVLGAKAITEKRWQ